MSNAVMRFKKSRKNQRGAVALEYILIASLVAIALIGAFVYFRGTLKQSVSAITDTTASAVNQSIQGALTEKDDKGKAVTSVSLGGE